jgi:hypothetical protein
MSARGELLATGRLGEAGAAMLYDIVGVVGVAHNFPPPEGWTSWDESAQQSVAHDFLQSHRGPKRLLDIAIRSVDDRSFERQLEKAVLNHLRDRARSTDLGKLIIRVKEVLRAADGFVAVPRIGEDRWAIEGSASEPSSTPTLDLAAAIRSESIVVPRWTSATRDAPLADRDTFVRLMRSVLLAARGSLTAREIAAVLTTRLDHRHVPLTVELDSAEGVSEPTDAAPDPSSRALSKLRAADIFGGLSDRERLIFTNLDLSVRELALAIDTGKSQAAQLRQRLTDRLITELTGDDDQQGTVSALADLCEYWLQQRTVNTRGTSDQDVLVWEG